MYYITGDKHGNFKNLLYFIKSNNLGENDTIIILGDSGLNYYVGPESRRWKKALRKTKCTFFIVRGNHEERPENINTYHEKIWNDGIVYIENDFPTLLFAKDGEEFNFNGKKILVIGGAYSIDKFYRLSKGWNWFADEKLSKVEMNKILDKVTGKTYDYVFTHTAPISEEPIELFMQGIDQSKVDKEMEKFLEQIKNNITFDKWFYGHYHGTKTKEKFRLMYDDIDELFVD